MQNLQRMFETLSGLEQVLWVMALVFGAMFAIVVVMRFLGLAEDHGSDDVTHTLDDGHDHSQFWGFFQPFTFTNFVTFMAVFSWFSLGGLANGQSPTVAMLIASAIGVAALLLVAWLFFMMSKATSSGTMNIANAVGKMGTAYITVPGAGKGVGQVQVTVDGAERTLQAINEQDADIPPGRPVKVVAARAEMLVVAAIG